MTIVASFDIGKKNFAFCIEEFDSKLLSTIKNIKKVHRYTLDKSGATPEFSALLNEVVLNGQVLLHKNLDLTENTEKGKYLDTAIFYNMIIELDKYKSFFDRCDVIVIEQQMSFKKAQNTMAIKLGQHCFSYFTMRYPLTQVNNVVFDGRKEVIEFPAYYKTQIIGAPKGLTKPQRKKWAVEKTREIFQLRGCEDYFLGVKKKDDLADTFLQLQSFKFLRFVDGSI